MGTTLEHGVYLPDEGERNCYAGLKVNWEILDQKVADISALQSAIAGALHREIVESLPTTDIDPNTIYMILNGTSATENIYNEYMYISNAWELIGTSATDLTNYYTKAEVDEKLLLKASASDLASHTGDTTIHVTASDKAKWNTVALIKQLRLVNAQVGSATTIAFANIDDTNGIKVGDKCMDLDGKMFEITAVDTTNQTVTVGSALIDLALDANVMHLSGDESVSGIKAFIGTRTEFKRSNGDGVLLFNNGSFIKGNTPNDIINICRKYYGDGTSIGGALGYNSVTVSNNGNKTIYQFYCLENTSGSTSRTTLQLNYDKSLSGNDAQYINITGSIFPSANNSYSLGNSSNKWKQINGLNPGALSLPDLNNGLDISGYITVVANANKESLYTPPANGWVCVRLSRTSGALGVLLIQGGMASSGKNIEVESGVTTADAMLPVVGGVQVSINSALADGVVSAYFYPCLGNV